MDDLLEKMTKSQYIRWAAWAEAMLACSEDPQTHRYDIPEDVKNKWKDLLDTPYEELSVEQKECLRRLAQERLDLFLR